MLSAHHWQPSLTRSASSMPMRAPTAMQCGPGRHAVPLCRPRGIITCGTSALQCHSSRAARRRSFRLAYQHTTAAGTTDTTSTSTSSGSRPLLQTSWTQPPQRLPGQFLVTTQQLQRLVNAAMDGRFVGSSTPTAEAVAASLGVDLAKGLCSDDAADLELRRVTFGANRLPDSQQVSFWQLLLEAASDTTLLILMAAGGASLALASAYGEGPADLIDGAAILSSVAICVGVTAVTNYDKESKFRALSALNDDIKVRVIRDGAELSLSTFELVVGDVVLVETGDILPADGVLCTNGDIRVDESHLTGESDDVIKDALSAPVLFSGSKVMEGFGRMLVVAVGPNSQQGIISSIVMAGKGGSGESTNDSSGSSGSDGNTSTVNADDNNSSRLSSNTSNSTTGTDISRSSSSSSSTTPSTTTSSSSTGREVASNTPTKPSNEKIVNTAETPASGAAALRVQTQLSAKLEVLAGQIGNVGIAAAGLTLLVNVVLYSGELAGQGLSPWAPDAIQAYFKFFITSITILVVAIPEGLPLAVTLALAFSVQRMLQDNNLVRHLDACETMACCTSVCSDKTGTLTQNDMKVVRLMAGDRAYNVRPSKADTASSTTRTSSTSSSSAGASPSSKGRTGADISSSAHASTSSNGSISSNRQGNGSPGSMTVVSLSWDGGDAGLLPDLPDVLLPDEASSSGQRDTSNTAAVGHGNGSAKLGSGADERWRLCQDVKDLLVQSIVLNSTASLRQDPETGSLERSGNRTECALLEFAARLTGSLDQGESVRERVEVLKTFQFSSERKRSSVVVAEGALEGVVAARAFTKGAAEIVLQSCTHQLGADGRPQALSDTDRSQLDKSFGRAGLRVLALAYKDIIIPRMTVDGVPGADLTCEEVESGLTLIGLVGLEDPVRPEVPAAIANCARAGITVRMLTGDNAATGAAIAAECGILPPGADLEVLLAASAATSARVREAEEAGVRPQMLGSSRSSGGSSGSSKGSDSESWTGNASRSGSSNGVRGIEGQGAREQLALQASSSSDNGTGHTGLILPAKNPDPALTILEGPAFRALVSPSSKNSSNGSSNGASSSAASGGPDLEAFAALWPHLRVLARCSPSDKYLLVQGVKALRRQGRLQETIAMTGDGTNDAPALTAADVGFAMASGTSIAKDASDILLLDDNFTSIVSAVKWGRNVYASITKFLQFQLTANVVAVSTTAASALFLRDSPLSAVQMLWVNLIMDSLASLSLATEAPEDSVLDSPPISPDAPLVTPTVIKNIAGQSVFQLGVLWWILGPGGDALGLERETQYTLLFNAFVMMQLFNQINARKIHDEPNVLQGILKQPLFLAILGLEAGLQAIIVQFGGRAFSTVPLDAQQWGVCVGFGAASLLVGAALRLVPTEPAAAAGGSSSGGP